MLFSEFRNMSLTQIILVLIVGTVLVKSLLQTFLKETENVNAINFVNGYGSQKLVLGYKLVESEEMDTRTFKEECKYIGNKNYRSTPVSISTLSKPADT